MKRLVWDKEKKKWVEEKEIIKRQEYKKIKEIIKETLKEVDFEIEFDLRTGKGRIRIKT